MPKFVISLPDGREVVRELTESQLTVGRADENTLQIDDPSVSTYHAELIRHGVTYTVKDLGSTNGTRVNGEPLIVETTLEPGDNVRFGKVEAVYQSEEPASARPKVEVDPSVIAVATSSLRPNNFGNVSPFHKKQTKTDPLNVVSVLLFVVAFLAFLASVVAIAGA